MLPASKDSVRQIGCPRSRSLCASSWEVDPIEIDLTSSSGHLSAACSCSLEYNVVVPLLQASGWRYRRAVLELAVRKNGALAAGGARLRMVVGGVVARE